MSNALAFFNKSLFMLRSVGFLGALGSYRGSIAIVSQLMRIGCAHKKVLSNAWHGESGANAGGLSMGAGSSPFGLGFAGLIGWMSG